MKKKNKLFIITALVMSGLGALVVALANMGTQTTYAQRTGGSNEMMYLPLVVKDVSCTIPNASYDQIPIASEPSNIPAAQHPDINLAIRGYEPTTAALTLVNYAGNVDPNAPQLDTLFATPRLPDFSSAYQIYRWDWACGCRGELMDSWDTNLLGMKTNPGETIHVPDSGYDIGGNHDVMVLYAAENRITLKYTREDNVVGGYTIHIEDVCVDPQLISLYNTLNAAGRSQLPALEGHQAFGRTLGNEIKVSVRDAGNFLDARSRKDWWQDY
ncbi:MAG: hypothetical protein H6657_13965 [Ardenticatenaceae bacterium]|nr:hypothetical protein [Ardenticatenaceae bacterium]